MITLTGEGEDPHQPTIPKVKASVYRELFLLSDWAIRTRPWLQMKEDHYFRIIDPKTGDDQIVSVLGSNEELYGVHIYLPEEGTRWLSKISEEGMTTLAQTQGQFNNRYLTIHFSDCEDFDDHDDDLDDEYAPELWVSEDESIFDDLFGVQFRSVLPGSPPWHPEHNLAERMVDGLRLLKCYFEQHFDKDDQTCVSLASGTPVKIPTFTLPKEAKRKEASTWKFSHSHYTPPGPDQDLGAELDPVIEAEISKFSIKKGTTWELGALYNPEPSAHEGKAVYTTMGFIGIAGHDEITGLEVEPATVPIYRILRQSFLRAAQELGHLPEKIAVFSQIGEIALSAIAKTRGIKLSVDPGNMPNFSHFARELSNNFLHREEEEILNDLSPDDFSFEALEELDQLINELPDENQNKEEFQARQKEIFQTEVGQKMLQSLIEKLGPEAMPEEILEMTGCDKNPKRKQKQAAPYRPPSSNERFIFRVDLVSAKPPIWRRISVPVDATFLDLHLAIQASFGWHGSHLHCFEKRINGQTELIIDWKGGDPEFMGLRMSEKEKESEISLNQFFRPGNETINYIYDFGDYWNHKIKLEKMVVNPADADVPLLEIIKGTGANPLEDCGGIHAWMELLQGTPPYEGAYSERELKEIQSASFNPERAHIRNPLTEMEILEIKNSY